MKLVSRLCSAIMLVIMSSTLYAGPHYLSGNISDMTTTRAGLMIMLDAGVPDNCDGLSYNWMLIKKEDTVMISTALAMWASGKTQVTVYTDPLASSTCAINQLDPA